MNRNLNSSVPIPTMNWHIADHCNFNCSYCCEGRSNGQKKAVFVSESVINGVVAVINELPKNWDIAITGGEPSTHPNFVEICKKVAATKHTVCLQTNLSFGNKKVDELVKACGDWLWAVSASYHLERMSIEEFSTKLQYIRKISPKTRFFLSAVMTTEYFKPLSEARKFLADLGFELEFRYLVIPNGFFRYSEEIESFMKKYSLKGSQDMINLDPYGCLCDMGRFFFWTDPVGNCFSCYYPHNKDYFLGSIPEKTFKLHTQSRVCGLHYCQCTLVVRRGFFHPKNK